MKYANSAVFYDPDTSDAIFLAIDGGRVGYVFGKSEQWYEEGRLNWDKLPELTFDQTVRQLAKKFSICYEELKPGSVNHLAMRVLHRKITGTQPR